MVNIRNWKKYRKPLKTKEEIIQEQNKFTYYTYVVNNTTYDNFSNIQEDTEYKIELYPVIKIHYNDGTIVDVKIDNNFYYFKNY